MNARTHGKKPVLWSMSQDNPLDFVYRLIFFSQEGLMAATFLESFFCLFFLKDICLLPSYVNNNLMDIKYLCRTFSIAVHTVYQFSDTECHDGEIRGQLIFFYL